MSYTIEFDREIYAYEDNSHTNYILLIKQGDNNMRNKDGTIAKNWELIATGWEYNIISKICKRSGATEGGSLKYQNGGTTPENYIKRYRKEVENAKPADQMFDDFWRVKIVAQLDNDIEEDYSVDDFKQAKADANKVKNVIEDFGAEEVRQHPYENKSIYEARLKDTKEFLDALDYPGRGYGTYSSWDFTLRK